MTEKTLDWLNANRYRAYPFVNDEGLVSDGVRVPTCVLLDCLVVDTTHRDVPLDLVFTGIRVTEAETTIDLSYGGRTFSYAFSGGETSGEGSFAVVQTQSPESVELHFRLVLSSHAYILEHAGIGQWSFRGRVLPTKIVSVPASGVSGLQVNGSEGEGLEGIARGDVTLADGYRTMPVIKNGRVLVMVGTKYGKDPCHHVFPDNPDKSVNCQDLLLFFCGQTASTNGDVVIGGGPGVDVSQGRTYTAKRDVPDSTGTGIGIRAGERVPCIEVKATPELLRIYTPTHLDDGSSS